MAKSISVVVPPKAAARVPVSKSSELVVPPNGMSRWVWTSIPPGNTYLPAASTIVPAFSRGRFFPMAEILPSLTATSPTYVSVAVATRPLTMMLSKPMIGFLPMEPHRFYARLPHLRISILVRSFRVTIEASRVRRFYAVRYLSQTRYDGGTHGRAHAPGGTGRIRVRLDFRFARLMARALSFADAYGDQHETDAARNLPDHSRRSRHHRDFELVRYFEPDLQRPHATGNWPRR